MLQGIFYTVCLYCGRDCDYSSMLCSECTAKLKRVTVCCKTCGHPLAVLASYCGYCSDRKWGINYYYTDYFFTGAAKKMMQALKFHWRLRGFSQLAKLCNPAIDFSFYDMAAFIPYHFSRILTRFIQPVKVIAKELSKKIVFYNILERTRYTNYQSVLSKAARRKNVKGAFRVKELVAEKKILLVDDIITTGSTLREAAYVIKKAGAVRVDAYTLFAGVAR